MALLERGIVMIQNHPPLFQCIDAGTENCPCSLAVSGNCLTCSRLAGKDCGDCGWPGVCIYNEFMQNGQKIKSSREEMLVPIVEKKSYGDDTIRFILDVGKGLAAKCFMPGSYLLIRSRELSEYYNAPISVMFADLEKGHVHVLIKAISFKTKQLAEETEHLYIKGPYKNGLLGLASLKAPQSQSFLIVAKGIGLSPAIKMAQYLKSRRQIRLLADPAQVDRQLLADYSLDQGAATTLVDLAESQDLELLRQEISASRHSAVCLFTSDYFLSAIGKMVKELCPAADIVTANNFNICCGEGVCGACSVAGEKGETIKMCKCQLDGKDLLRRKVVWE